MTNFWNIKVAENKQRKYIKDIATIWLGKETMSKQAKTLSQQEVRRVLDYTATRKHALRNRCLVLTTFLSGMRVGEVASLRYKDVVDTEGNVRKEIRLRAEVTKTKEARIVFVNERLQKELQQYVNVIKLNTVMKQFKATVKVSGVWINTIVFADNSAMAFKLVQGQFGAGNVLSQPQQIGH